MASYRAPRSLVPADLDRVAEIERTTFSDPWSRRAFAETLVRREVRGFAVDDERGVLAGYGLCAVAADEGEILNVAVDPGARGRGVGRSIVVAMLDHLRGSGVRRVYLEVRCSNEAAIGLYRAAGFRPLAKRQGYYVRPREDALTMVLEMPSREALE
jgi:ribosomal-protein-alanine N-acetyltransferase